VVARDKFVETLGTRGRLPVEVVPFALPLVERRLAEARALERAMRAVAGVVDTGLFLGIADTGLVADGTSVSALTRKR
jgi:ribose 5-phosphate isomerase